MSPILEWLSAFMDRDAHGPMSCSALPFKTWYEPLVRELEEKVKHKEVLESRESGSHTTTFLKWRPKRRIVCRRPGSTAVTL